MTFQPSGASKVEACKKRCQIGGGDIMDGPHICLKCMAYLPTFALNLWFSCS